MKWFCKLNLFTILQILQKGWEGDHFSLEKWQLEKLEDCNLSTKIVS